MANLKDLIVNRAARVIGKVYAPEFVGKLTGNADTATTATNLGTSNVGSNTTPIYLSAGTPTAIGYTIAKNVPANAEFTDTKVTAVGNHYTPSTDSSSALNVDASSTTSASWNSTSLVTGVNISRDAKGHVTGLTVDSIKMPANPNTDTHYTAKNVVASSSTGTANVTAATDNPYVNLIENGTVRSTHQIKGSGATTVKTDTSGNIVISSTDTNTHYKATPVLGATDAVANATSKTSDPYLNISENGGKSGGIQIKGSGATSVSAANGIITISSTDTNTTYSNKTAASGGTDVSLVTTGEKYTWNSKANGVHNHTKSDITDFPTLAAVATSGNFRDLSDKPPYIENMVNTEDLNYLVTSGFYRIKNGQANAPGDWGQLLVVHGGEDTIGQLYFSSLDGALYSRAGNPPQVGGSGSWLDWRRLWREGDAVSGAVFN